LERRKSHRQETTWRPRRRKRKKYARSAGGVTFAFRIAPPESLSPPDIRKPKVTSKQGAVWTRQLAASELPVIRGVTDRYRAVRATDASRRVLSLPFSFLPRFIPFPPLAHRPSIPRQPAGNADADDIPMVEEDGGGSRAREAGGAPPAAAATVIAVCFYFEPA